MPQLIPTTRASMTRGDTSPVRAGESRELVIDEFIKSLAVLQDKLGLEKVIETSIIPAWELLAKCIDAPIPSFTGELSRSAFVEKLDDGIRIGFDAPHASVMNFGGDIKLNVPGYGSQKRTKKGTFASGFEDKEVTVYLEPNPYGSAKGPNYYFSGTLETEMSTFFLDLVEQLENQIYQSAAGRRRGSTKLFDIKFPTSRAFGGGPSAHFRGGRGTGLAGKGVGQGQGGKVGGSQAQYINRRVVGGGARRGTN